jgi:hypothetical protein
MNDQPAWDALLAAHPTTFQWPQAKAAYRTDAYFVDLKFGPLYTLRFASYYCGLFSHNRAKGLWKGTLEVELSPASDDAAASQLLSTL